MRVQRIKTKSFVSFLQVSVNFELGVGNIIYKCFHVMFSVGRQFNLLARNGFGIPSEKSAGHGRRHKETAVTGNNDNDK